MDAKNLQMHETCNKTTFTEHQQRHVFRCTHRVSWKHQQEKKLMSQMHRVPCSLHLDRKTIPNSLGTPWCARPSSLLNQKFPRPMRNLALATDVLRLQLLGGTTERWRLRYGIIAKFTPLFQMSLPLEHIVTRICHGDCCQTKPLATLLIHEK